MKKQHIQHTLVVFAAIIALGDAVHAQESLSRNLLKGVEIGVRGCVMRGVDRGTVVLDNILELGRDGVARPPVPPGFPTAVYSFDSASRLTPFVGRMVEVHGRIKDVKNSTVKIKEKDGALVAELPTAGRDVKATLDEVPTAVGTSGTDARINSVTLRIDVDRVMPIDGSCPNR